MSAPVSRWRLLVSWFEWMKARRRAFPEPFGNVSSARRRQRRPVRPRARRATPSRFFLGTLNRLEARSLVFEQCEPRQLLAADIAIDRFYSDGTVWKIDYSIAGTAQNFDIAVYRSANGVSPDGEAIQTRTVNTDLGAGSYTLPITPSFNDDESDYFLIADIEPSAGDLTDEAKLFDGGIFVSGSVVHVHGTSGIDTIDVARPGTLDVTYNGEPAVTFPSESVTSVHVRSHGGHDSMTFGTGVSQSVWAFGGAGDDTYSVAVTNSSGSAKIVEAAGNGTDTLDFDDSTVGVNVNLGKTTSQFLGSYSLSLSDAAGIENLIGTNYDDTLIGNGLANSIDGQEGNDMLYGDDPTLNARVVGRRIFYNQSGTASPLIYDGNNAAINSNDDRAIATDKVALLPGAGPATFASVSTYSKGINGIMIDIAGAHGTITASDFIFRVGNNNSRSDWTAAPTPTSVSVRVGAGVSGSDRIEIVWPNNAIEKKWLEVTTKANANTLLAQNPALPLGQADIFYFGNVIGDTGLGDSSMIARVNAIDEGDARSNAVSLANNIPITNIHDFNRDAAVNVYDQIIARYNSTGSANALKYINIANLPEPPNIDTLTGGAGDDTLTVTGTSADDTVNVTNASVTLNSNMISYSEIENLVLDGGAGSDAYTVTQPDVGFLPAFVTVNDTWTGIWCNNSLSINGSSGPDELTLTDGGATVNATTIVHTGMTSIGIAGGDGNDNITMTGGYEVKALSGGAGDDTFNINTGSFCGILRGDSGRNTYAFHGFAQGTYTIDQTGGQADTLSFSEWAIAGVSVNLLSDVQQSIGFNLKLTLAGASDTITAVVGTNLADTITANNLGNFLQGGPGNDTLNGGAGDDTLQGGVGDDTLNGGDGLDTILTGLGEGAPTYHDTVNDMPGASGLHQPVPRQVFLGNPEEFVFADPSATGLKYSFALTESGLVPYATASTNSSQSLVFPSAGTQAVWGRIFQSADAYTTYRTDVTVDLGYGLSGEMEVSAVSGPYGLLLISGSNTDSAVYTDWIVDWGDGTTEHYSHLNPTVTNPVVVTHIFPEQTGVRKITASVSDGVHSPVELAPFVVRVLDDEPFPPENVKAQSSGTSVIVMWDHPSGPAASTYTIFSSDNGIDDWEIWWGPISSAEPTSVSRPAYEKKFFKMVAENEHGRSLESPVFTTQFRAEDGTVEVSAQAQTSSIVLDWPLDIEATQYTVYRRVKGDTDWGVAIGTAPGNSTGFEDPDVSDGSAYEYKVIQSQQLQSVGQYFNADAIGYIYAGINAPFVEDRGTTILLVDDTFSASLASEIARLQQDLVGDGWKVIRHDVARATSVQDVKALIHGDYDLDPDQVKQVVLLGHLAVPYAGYVGPDGHADHQGAWSADIYYADMDGTWTDVVNFPHGSSDSRNWNDANDGKFDQSDLSDSRTPELAVGRIDMWGMSSTGTYSIDEEALLLRRYLDRDHDFRNGVFIVPRQAFFDTELGLGSSAVSGFRNLAPLVGDANIDVPPFGISESSYFPNVTGSSAYLWSYAEGQGHFDRAARIGTTADFMSQQAKVVFTILRGSYFGDWDVQDSFLRAPLAGQGYGLTTVWENFGGAYYRMGLGETIGESIVYTQHGELLLPVTSNGIWTALMGDPSLRMHVVQPPSQVSATRNGNDIDVTWLDSPDSTASGFQGYNVYRSTPTGSFTRLNPSPRTELSFTDTTADAGNYVYMVRTVKLETGSSGTYYNASQGAFDNMGAATLLGVDGAAQGDWKTVYGNEGYDIIGDAASYPSYADVTTTGTVQVWELPTTDERGLLFSGSSARLAAAWHAQPGLTIDVNLTDGVTHQISLYAVDWDHAGRAQRVQVFDAENGSLLLSEDLREFSDGNYLKLRLSGHVQIRVTSLGASDAVLSGIFFDA
jgi:Ca2+-binding RTX toxin-like protein